MTEHVDPRLDPVVDEIMSTVDADPRATEWATNFANRVLAAADKAATIGGATSRNETAAAIEALPDGTVVADTTDDIFQLRGGLWCSYESVPLTGFQLAKYAPITILRHGATE